MISGTNLVKDIMRTVAGKLASEYGEREAGSVVDLLFEERFGINRVSVTLNPELRLTESQIVQVHKDMRELMTGMPVQYVLGYSGFLGLRFKVNPSVLIPRPETEELVSYVIKVLNVIQNPVVLDIGTGSGAIAVAIKSAYPSARVFALDNCDDALSVAAENAAYNNTEIVFFLHDILNDRLVLSEKPDCMISNPPYIPFSEIPQIAANVKNFEPGNALFVEDDDPLIFYRRIGEEGLIHLTEGGWLMVETHTLFTVQVADLFRSMGFNHTEIHIDINGKNRFVLARNSDGSK